MKFGTKVIHAHIKPDPSTGAIMTPIFQTSTYVQKAPGDHHGFEYARTQNPTRSVLEKNLAALENGNHGIAFSSGMAATDAIMKTLSPGDEVIATNDLYGGTYRLFTKMYAKYGIEFRFVDLEDAEALKKIITHKTKLLWIETPTNPMLNIVDIKEICKTVNGSDVKVCVDNTFATPFLQRPLDLGADMVLHSATKYLAGHSDVILGAVVCKDAELAEELYFIQNGAGAVPGPQDCFLTLRGIKTLHLRVQRACENAAAVANYLSGHPKVNKVYYPGLKDHPNHDIANKQMKLHGGMVSFNQKDDTLEAANKTLTGTTLFQLAESLGGVESLIGHPASMTHASIPHEERMKTGVTDSLIRLSVGIEDIEDLLADLEKALG
ncbi:MAG: cystathionine gamma-synthase [Bacteroidetes bacterium]|nr:cystathionine gamma-synthase [Bacteroidota bacterium]